MKNYLARAMAIALMVGVLGLAATPGVVASHNTCHKDFTLGSIEPILARSLDPQEFEIGRTDVTANDGNKTLRVLHEG